MTYSPIQLDIIRTFGSKELSFGCNVKYKGVYEKVVFYSLEEERLLLDLGQYEADRQDIEILGHRPELFPDVARVAKEKGYYMSSSMESSSVWIRDERMALIVDIPYNPTLPLIEQDSQLTLIPLLNLFNPS